MRELPRGTVTFLFTDVEGSTRLLHELGADGYARALAEHRRALRGVFSAHGGVEVDTQGDAFFYAFPSAEEAVRAAGEGCEALPGPIRVRVGLHTGSPHVTDEGYVGEDVHLGARVAAAGHGGQVLFSRATRELVEAEVLDLGEHRLKDFAEPVWIFQLGSQRFPPLKTISNTNLPRPASTFVGRERETAAVVSLIREGARLVTLTGPGGSGKTRLAIEASAELVPDFRNGVFWVGLAGLRDPGLVLETVAQAIGAKDGLAEYVGGRELLLLLDNLEQVVEAAPDLAELLEAGPDLRLLVTSRERLRVRGEAEYAVPSLSGREAVELFSVRSGLRGDETIAELCRRLDDLPLAVELAAARTSVLSPRQILERLGQRLDLLKGGRDAEARQLTLRATIEWSYELLSPVERGLFSRLAVFAGGCTLEAAEQVAHADLDTLQSLVDKSLVRFTTERYWMLETIRELALETLDRSSYAPDSRLRHAEWLGALIAAAEPELEGSAQDSWLDRLEAEHDNLREALRWAVSEERELALRLAAASATFWWVRGHWGEGRRWLDQALARSEGSEPALRARALEGAANLASRQGDHERARELASEAVELSRALGDAGRLARALRVLGLVAVGEGEDDQYNALFEESAAHARDAGDGWALLMALNNLGYSSLSSGDPARAAELFREALSVSSERGDRRSEAFIRENLALALLEEGTVVEARHELTAALHLAQQLGFVEVAAECLGGLAAVEAAEGSWELAAELLGGAERLREEIDSGLDPVEARVRDRTVEVVSEGLGSRDALEALRARGARGPEALIERVFASID